jgi:hypothetical protein
MDELIEHFSSLEDPRCPGKITYPLLDILAITVCAVIAGAARNLALLRKTAINLLNRDSSQQGTVRARRKRTAWDDDYMMQVLSSAFPAWQASSAHHPSRSTRARMRSTSAFTSAIRRS